MKPNARMGHPPVVWATRQGFPIDAVDTACMLHDFCYNEAGISADSQNKLVYLSMSDQQKRAMRNCNQNLCNDVAEIYPKTRARPQIVAIDDIIDYFEDWSYEPCH